MSIISPPLFIVSTGRCGSTLFLEMLDAHPCVAGIREFWSYRPNREALMSPELITGENLWMQLATPMPADLHRILAAGLIPTALRIHPLQDNVLLRATLPALFGDKATHTLAALQRYVSAMSGMNKSAAFHAIFDFLTNRVGKRVWIEKTGGSLRYVDHLLGLWPDARLIVLVRDGRQCVRSMARHPTFVYAHTVRHAPLQVESVCQAILNGEFDDALIREYEVSMARAWSQDVTRAVKYIKDLHSDRLLFVRYENLLHTPERVLLQAVHFITGRSVSAKDVEWLETQSARVDPGKSRRTASTSSHARRISDACDAGLEVLGYDK